jgi:hypothetical protein
MKHVYAGAPLPKQWNLIKVIIEKNPQFFVDERLKQKDKEIALWKSQYDRMREDRDILQTKLAEARGYY